MNFCLSDLNLCNHTVGSIYLSNFQAAPFIQVFINLKELNDVVQNIKESALLAIKQATKTALDIKSLTNQSAEPEKKPAFKSISQLPISTVTTILCNKIHNLLYF